MLGNQNYYILEKKSFPFYLILTEYRRHILIENRQTLFKNFKSFALQFSMKFTTDFNKIGEYFSNTYHFTWSILFQLYITFENNTCQV